MLKLLFLLAFGLVIWLFFKSLSRPRRPSAPARPGAEDMVRCARCGVHLPRSESLMSAGKFYCCREHSESDER